MEKSGLSSRRRELVSRSRGATVEVGAGTGLNLVHYPAELTSLVLTEPDPHMARRLRKRADRERPDAQITEAPAERLPFPDDSFDTAIATLILCTVPDPGAALREIARVLSPGGSFLFLEHVRADSGSLGRWQDRAVPVQRFLFGGCHPNRQTAAAIEASPLEMVELRQDAMPRAAGPIVRPLIAASRGPSRSIRPAPAPTRRSAAHFACIARCQVSR